MHEKLDQKLSELTQTTDKLLTSLSMRDHEILQKKPDKNEWSIIQVLAHLILTERASLAYIQKKVLGIDDLHDVGAKEKIKMRLSKLIYTGIFRFKARVSSISNPSNSNTIDQISSEWREVRQEMKNFIEDYPDEFIDVAIYKHPILGRLSMSQMFEFLNDHIHHHEHQIKRILKKI